MHQRPKHREPNSQNQASSASTTQHARTKRDAQQSGSGFLCINDQKNTGIKRNAPRFIVRLPLRQRPKTFWIKRNAHQSGSGLLCTNDQKTGKKRNAQQFGSGSPLRHQPKTLGLKRTTVWIRFLLHQRQETLR